MWTQFMYLSNNLEFNQVHLYIVFTKLSNDSYTNISSDVYNIGLTKTSCFMLKYEVQEFNIKYINVYIYIWLNQCTFKVIKDVWWIKILRMSNKILVEKQYRNNYTNLRRKFWNSLELKKEIQTLIRFLRYYTCFSMFMFEERNDEETKTVNVLLVQS